MKTGSPGDLSTGVSEGLEGKSFCRFGLVKSG